MVLLEPPRRGGSNEYPQSMFEQKYDKYQSFFLSEKFKFLEVKFSIYLNRSVFVMYSVKSHTCNVLNTCKYYLARYISAHAWHNINQVLVNRYRQTRYRHCSR